MKNFVKISLFGLVAGATFFGINQIYAACPLIGNVYICSIGNQCDQTSCLCQSATISNGTTCSLAVLGDGVKTTLTGYGVGCSDVDGCLCPDLTPLVGPSCVAPVVIAPVISSLGTPSVVGLTANFNFSSDKTGSIFYIGSCGAGTPSNAIISSNTVVFNLPNITKTYNDCKLYVQDSSQMVSNILSIPSFNITASTGTVTPPTTTSTYGGGSGTPTCYFNDLVCVNGKFVRKVGTNCDYGDLGKTCSISGGTGELYNIIYSIPKLTQTGFEGLLEEVKTNTKYSTLKEYTVQGIKIKLYVPKYTLAPIRNAVASLSKSLISAIDKKLIKLNDYSYIIENYETIGTDQKILVYKEIGAITKLYNDMMATLYMVLDMKKSELLPLAKYFLKTYINEIIKFKK